MLDIGANIGFYARLLSDIVGEGGEVHCFEPDSTNFEHLKKNVGTRKNIFLNNVAAAANTGSLKIYTSKSLNVDHRTYKPEVYDQEIEIKGMSVDDYLRSGTDAEKKINLIKIDIQGFEAQAMQGMEKTIAANPAVKIISEFWPYGLKKAGSSLSSYYGLLIKKGFTCYLLEKNSLQELRAEKVAGLEDLGEAHYFNIFATREHV